MTCVVCDDNVSSGYSFSVTSIQSHTQSMVFMTDCSSPENFPLDSGARLVSRGASRKVWAPDPFKLAPLEGGAQALMVSAHHTHSIKTIKGQVNHEVSLQGQSHWKINARK